MITPTAGNVSVRPYSSTAVPARAVRDRGGSDALSEVGVAM